MATERAIVKFVLRRHHCREGSLLTAAAGRGLHKLLGGRPRPAVAGVMVLLLLLLSCSTRMGLLLQVRHHAERALLLLLRLLLLLLLLRDDLGSGRRRLTRLDDLHDLRMWQPPSSALTVSSRSVSTCALGTAQSVCCSTAADNSERYIYQILP